MVLFLVHPRNISNMTYCNPDQLPYIFWCNGCNLSQHVRSWPLSRMLSVKQALSGASRVDSLITLIFEIIEANE